MDLRALARRRTTPEQRKRLRRLAQWPPVGGVRLGSLGRTRPISRTYGWERGTPIDRFYIDAFLGDNESAIRGRVLEIGDDEYTRKFGKDEVTTSDVLHAGPGNPQATIVADLADAPHIDGERFDCVICTQTLLLVYDVRSAVQTLHRILAPGGVLLATVPGISQIDRGEWGETWFWSFTRQSARRTFEMRFAPADVAVDQYGNVLAAIAFLEGLAGHELEEHELAVTDPAYPVCVAVRAVKGGER